MKKVKKKDISKLTKKDSSTSSAKKYSSMLKESSESISVKKKSKKDKKAKRKSFIGAKFDSNALLENQKVKDVLKKKKKK